MLRLLSARVVVAALVGLAAGASGGFALADAVGGSVPGPAAKAAALDRLASVATTDASTEPAPTPDTAPRPIPAQMLGDDVPVPVAPSVLRVRDAWLVSDGETLVAVYAGAAGDEPSVGRVVIVRQNLAAGKQTVRVLDAGSAGGLTIAAAPLGRAVETSAQTGTLRLRTGGGGLITLDLGSERVSHDAHKARLP
jgi:hypothetical protein